MPNLGTVVALRGHLDEFLTKRILQALRLRIERIHLGFGKYLGHRLLLASETNRGATPITFVVVAQE